MSAAFQEFKESVVNFMVFYYDSKLVKSDTKQIIPEKKKSVAKKQIKINCEKFKLYYSNNYEHVINLMLELNLNDNLDAKKIYSCYLLRTSECFNETFYKFISNEILNSAEDKFPVEIPDDL